MDLNLIGDFYSISILSREGSGEVVAREGSHEAQTSTCGAAHQAGHATRARLALGGCITSVFLWSPLFRQKMDALFFYNFLRRWRRQNHSSTSGRADLLLPPKGNRRH
jgi:hypothetical protein